MRHTDWQEVDRKLRPQVTAATTPKELFQILQQMIEPLLTPDEWVKADDLVGSKYLIGKPQVYCNGHVQFAMLNDFVGYLRVDAFNSYAKGGYLEGGTARAGSRPGLRFP